MCLYVILMEMFDHSQINEIAITTNIVSYIASYLQALKNPNALINQAGNIMHNTLYGIEASNIPLL